MTPNPVIVALDVASAEDALRLARLVAPAVGGFKIGLGLLMGPGPGVTKAIASLGRPVFVDAKLHDIPSTVSRASEQLGRLGVRWVTAHGMGGAAMLEAAVAGLQAGSRAAEAGVLAVTVLTSSSRAGLSEVGIQGTTGTQTARLAKLAGATGCEGVVCPGLELGVVAAAAPELLRVVPGIRPPGVDVDDQTQVMSPAEAVARGADLIVVGRPIISAPDPRAAAESIAEQALSRWGT